MAVSFPTSPSSGDTFNVGRVKYEWSGSAWKQVSSQPVSTGAEIPFIKSDGTTSDPIKLASSVIGNALVNDTTPQLGGSLDVNGNAIVSASNANIAITPNGSGKVVLDGISWPNADGSPNYILKTNGSGVLSWAADAAGTITALNNATANELVTVGATTTELDAESGLTFDGSTLAVAGALSATGNVSFDGGSFVFNEAGADKDFRIEGDTQANLFVADASTDRIGIGTAAPTDPLTLSYAATDYATGLVVHNTNTAGYGATIRFETEYGGGTDKHAAISATAAGAGGALDFYTGSDATTLNRVMRIDNTGKVGIGVAAPDNLLHLESSTAAGAVLQIESTATNGYPYLRFKNDAVTWDIYGAHGGAGDGFQIAGSAGGPAYTFTSTGLGIGTTSPSGALEVIVTPGVPVRITDPSASANASEPSLAFYGSTDGGTRLGYVGIGSTANSEFRVVNSQNDDMWFGTNNTERMRILAGGGVTFNGDTSTANALDDYEEGTWTGVMWHGGLAFSMTSQHGYYTKIGRQVTCVFSGVVNSSDGWAHGLGFRGLPFTSANNSGQEIIGHFQIDEYHPATGSNSTHTTYDYDLDMAGIIYPNSTYIYPMVWLKNGGARRGMDCGDIYPAPNKVNISVTYFV